MLSTFNLADNIIGFIVDGSYDERAVESIQTQVIEKLELFDKLSLYIEDTENADISIKSVMKNVPFKLKTGNRFQKVAVVTDRKWLQVVSNFEKLFFSAEIRIFSGHQRLDAIQWISH
ncbi:STAS/SEC14 domain-containing protein [Aequorivita sp. SDUM287046]|uniref:STAS/SEC14 domain-containing protein n=1 Tax=Aequorivita aurantiaca TaxID=3053356 RepID=A0ABT8DPW5_9FLAO|nr:STAS/SEC14 domain-containing protein [Aequorivita aurantiaca]MDN3725255.1 STAS/SEC14 domain-containing protein [Aequorivita aurantiaca]